MPQNIHELCVQWPFGILRILVRSVHLGDFSALERVNLSKILFLLCFAA